MTRSGWRAPVMLSRRSAIALGGAMLGSPRAFAGQKPAPVVGLLDSAASSPDALAAFYDGLKAEGFVRNRTIDTLYHSAAGDYARLPALAADLVKHGVAAVAAFGVPAALAAKNASAATPLVFAIGPDPVPLGLVRNLDRPGNDSTGVTALAAGREVKRLQLLHALVPGAPEIALLLNPAGTAAGARLQEVEAAARALDVRLRPVRAGAANEFDAIFDSLAAAPPGGLVVADDALFDSRAADLGFLAFRHRIAAVFQGRAFAAAGGLVAYGSNFAEIYHQAGAYVGLVLNGAGAASLPVFQSVKIDFIVNAKAAASLGLVLPAAMIGAADDVIR